MVLAAGAGTRLRPLTTLRPKPLCPVGDRPLVDHALDAVAPHAGAVAVNVHAGRSQMEEHLADRVHLSFEDPVALGTAGAVGNLAGWLDGRDVLVRNADAYSGDTLADLVDGWDRERVRLLVVDDPPHGDFGRWRYAGACLLPGSIAARLSPAPAGLYEVCWRSEEAAGRLDLVSSEATFIDCGTPRDYLQANLDWSGGANVVGAGAMVRGTIERCVVWPNAIVEDGEHLVAAIRADGGLTVLTEDATNEVPGP